MALQAILKTTIRTSPLPMVTKQELHKHGGSGSLYFFIPHFKMASHNKNKVWFCGDHSKDIAIEKESVAPGDCWIPRMLQFFIFMGLYRQSYFWHMEKYCFLVFCFFLFFLLPNLGIRTVLPQEINIEQFMKAM